MFGKRFKLFTLFGFEVGIDLSWLVIAFLVVWSLASGFFPYQYPGLTQTTYWTMGILGAVGLFLSIIFHEFWHSFLARSYGMPMHGITLFLFGGVSEMHDEPPSAKIEFQVAVVGPISSIVLGFIFAGILQLGRNWGWPAHVSGLIGYLAMINWIVAVFNLLPAFPLDGGRILRAAIWKWKGDLRQATKTASKVGGFFGVLLIILGLLNMLTGNIVGGMWYVIIGLFIRSAAYMGYRQLLIRSSLEGRRVSRHMREEPVTVPSTVSVRQLVEDYMYKYHFKMFPVVDNGRLQGCVTSKEVKGLDSEEWDRHTVAELATNCTEENTVSSDTDMMDAMNKMNRSGQSRLLVVDNGHLSGVIALKDIMGFLSMHMDLEELE
ncbi:MAG: site-2 protease family protein [Desulfohalobiaceae bacterium]|nr:site-2 protease family protein [Desulfohalobiaceae bacterium]